MKSQMNKVVEEAKVRDTLNKGLAVFVKDEVLSPDDLYEIFQQVPTHDSVKLHSIVWHNPETQQTFILQFTMMRVIRRDAAHAVTVTQHRIRKGEGPSDTSLESVDLTKKEAKDND